MFALALLLAAKVITEAEIAHWTDFRRRAGLREATLAAQ
jgi:hypothetical protein